MKKGILLIGLIATLVVLSGCTQPTAPPKNLALETVKSPGEIYSQSRESIFFAEYDCKGTAHYPDFDFNSTYDPKNDSFVVIANPLSTDLNESFDVNQLYSGSAFAATDRIFTNAHVIEECTPAGFQNNVKFGLNGYYGYATPEEIGTVTNQKISADFITAKSREFLLDINKDHETALTEEQISGAVTDAIIRYLYYYSDANLTSQSMQFIQSTKGPEDAFVPAILKKGDVWPGKDFVILKAEQSFPNLKFGDSNEIQIGDEVYVIGYPAAAEISTLSKFEPTITKGIISAIKTSESGEKYLQIDAAVSGGNSGGPVFNKKGEVIGILTVGSYETQGFNFVFPSNSIPAEN